ncbi:hypothetical protein EIP91_004981 [Steccherinum ochraceum]|uniref:Uncharacterized protein n=1 Tax=Steccherinum ochraceum TaxID=92696 RepID=A0A4R0RAG3_9APHY|nr:hypothetical protein EIP91_004981 [Steccherinum ochraceum]
MQPLQISAPQQPLQVYDGSTSFALWHDAYEQANRQEPDVQRRNTVNVILDRVSPDVRDCYHAVVKHIRPKAPCVKWNVYRLKIIIEGIYKQVHVEEHPKEPWFPPLMLRVMALSSCGWSIFAFIAVFVTPFLYRAMAIGGDEILCAKSLKITDAFEDYWTHTPFTQLRRLIAVCFGFGIMGLLIGAFSYVVASWTRTEEPRPSKSWKAGYRFVPSPRLENEIDSTII